MGNSASAVEAHLKALSLDNKYKEAIINLGQAYKDWGKATKAMEQFNRAVSVDPQSVGAHHCRALLWFGLGRHNTALEDFTRACQRDPRHWEARWMRAVTLNGLGQIRASLRDYDEALSMKPDHWCWFQKEIALYWHHRLDTPLEDYNMDQELDPVFKEFWCKRQQPSSLPNKAKVSQPPVDPSIADIDYDEHPASYTPETWKLLELAWDIGKLLHQEAPGFLFNRRQLKMAGLAAVEVAQKLRSVWGTINPL
jgi:tetratricopeptide (TPR) repeat protein